MENWYVLKTKPNREFFVCDQLSTRAIETYLPVSHSTALNSSKQPRPYFPSYLFTKVDLQQVSLSSLVYMPGVNYMLMSDGKPTRVEQSIIDSIRSRILLLENSALDSMGQNLARGDMIRITGGVFEGYEAIFDKRLSGGDRVQILIDFLQKQRPVTIERNLIEKQLKGVTHFSQQHAR